jgi:hypothetical protein
MPAVTKPIVSFAGANQITDPQGHAFAVVGTVRLALLAAAQTTQAAAHLAACAQAYFAAANATAAYASLESISLTYVTASVAPT